MSDFKTVFKTIEEGGHHYHSHWHLAKFRKFIIIGKYGAVIG